MVELVALVGHRHRVDDLAKSRRPRLHVDDRESIGFGEIRAKQQRVGEVLRWSLHCELRRCMKGWVRSHCHRVPPLKRTTVLSVGHVWPSRPSSAQAKGTYCRRLHNGVCSSSVRRRCQAAASSDRTGVSSSGTSSLGPPTTGQVVSCQSLRSRSKTRYRVKPADP